MAVRALPPGAVKRRTFFGLLDADGWGAAFFKALFWFLFLIFMLMYIPDRAYYFTVSKTIDVGFNGVPILNWCPGSNESLPCPAPPGSVVPWQASPPQLDLPAGRMDATAFQSGTNLYLVGGRTAAGPTADVLATSVTTDGNYGAWTEGPALPEPRTGAAVTSLSGIPYVIGGLDANGQPTTTVFMGTLAKGVLTGWTAADTLTLPTAVSDAMAVSAPTGLYLFGGRTADGVVTTVLHSALGTDSPPKLGAWADAGVPLPEGRADGNAVAMGDQIYVVGGDDPTGVATASVFRLTLASGVVRKDPTTNAAIGWAVAPAAQQLPDARARGASFTANGAMYIIGGVDATGQPQDSNDWTVPNTVGDIPAWSRTPATDLVEARAGASITNVGSFVFVIGGQSPSGPSVSTMRANISPQPPYFRIGLFGLTIPSLAIQGEIGQQLGYIDAFGVGIVNFIIVILIGLAYSHRQATMRIIERLSRGRFRAPRDEEYPIS